jgi:serine/threonine protein kinase
VRLGRDQGGRPVAVKVYQHREAVEQPCVARHLYNEARLAGRLEHANIIAPRRAVHRDGRTELEMEFAPGGHLGDYVARRRGLTEPEARRIFVQLVEGVGYLHGRDIAHRDIKLENVVLGANGTAKLCDFGAAREGAADLTRSIQGTPAYMAPECHAGSPHRAAPADVWCAAFASKSPALCSVLPDTLYSDSTRLATHTI